MYFYPFVCLADSCRYVLQQLRSLASGELDTAVLPRARRLVCAGPLEFLRLVLAGDQHVELKVQVMLPNKPIRQPCMPHVIQH